MGIAFNCLGCKQEGIDNIAQYMSVLKFYCKKGVCKIPEEFIVE